MTLPRLAAPVALLAVACVAAASTASANTLVVTASTPSVIVRPGITAPTAPATSVFFGGMRSPEGKARGFLMGFADLPTGATNPSAPSANGTLAFAFGSGARMVALWRPSVRSDAPVPLVGGTGTYLGARGTERATYAKGRFTHTITYTLPATGTPRTREDYIMRLGKAVTTERGGADGVGNGRSVAGTFTTTMGEPAGTYLVNSVLEHVYSGGLYEWYVGDATYTFSDGSTLRAVGPYQRATSAAAGALNPSGRVVASGTGRYKGMRGQVVVLPTAADGTAVHSFTLVK
jgi:hypothetical protein